MFFLFRFSYLFVFYCSFYHHYICFVTKALVRILAVIFALLFRFVYSYFCLDDSSVYWPLLCSKSLIERSKNFHIKFTPIHSKFFLSHFNLYKLDAISHPSFSRIERFEPYAPVTKKLHGFLLILDDTDSSLNFNRPVCLFLTALFLTKI